RDGHVTGVQTCALPISIAPRIDLGVCAIRTMERVPLGIGRAGGGEVADLSRALLDVARMRRRARIHLPVVSRVLEDVAAHLQLKIGRASCRERVAVWVG